jgi:hypothetical protein
MKQRWFIGVILICFFTNVHVGFSLEKERDEPRTFLVKLEHLELVKNLLKDRDPVIERNLKMLVLDADEALKRGPYSVTQKKYKHPSGYQHDFLAYGGYCWPNSNTKDGLPWVLRDGHRNPETAMDWKLIRPMATAVQKLAFAYYLTNNEAYAKHAALLLHTWFIDKDTRMNPNLNYGKVIPGVREGGYPVARFGNVIRKVYDSAGILESSYFWSDADRKALQRWTQDFIRWMETSPYGKKELSTQNNHTTFYHMTRMLMSMYTADNKRAKDALRSYMKRLPKQFLHDGTQPFEMRRANNYYYHQVNLKIAFDIAQMADHLKDFDVWNFRTDQGAGLRKSIEFLVPYFTGQQKWGYFKDENFEPPSILRWRLLRRAAVGFNDWTFEKAAKKIVHKDNPLIELCYPEVAISRKRDAALRNDK